MDIPFIQRRNGDRSAKKEMDWSGSQCNLYVNLEDNGTQVMDFQDKYALLDMMYDEANEYYKDNK